MKKKLLKYIILVIVILSFVTTMLNVKYVRENYINEKTKELERDAKTISIYLNDSSIIEEIGSNFVKDEIRITLVNGIGNVIYDTDKSSSEMFNHSNRPEIQEAYNGNIGVETRFSNTLKKEMLYVAYPVNDNDSNVKIIRLSIPINTVNYFSSNALKNFLIISIIGIIISVIFLLKVVSFFTEPILRLSNATELITRGAYTGKLYHNSTDEIGQLYKNFNVMSEKLDKTIKELKNSNTMLNSILSSMVNGIIAIDKQERILFLNNNAANMLEIDKQDVQSRKIIEVIRDYEIVTSIREHLKVEKECFIEIKYKDKIYKIYINSLLRELTEVSYGAVILIQDITEMRKLEHMRSDFVANVSHELKTPLTSIKGFIETLKNHNVKDEKTRERFIEIMDIEADRLKTLIDDLLLLSNIENNDGNKIEFNINDTINEVLDLMSNIAKQKNVSLMTISDNDYSIYGNKNRFKQMLINLIDNGIKYNKVNGYVKIEISKVSENLEIIIEDNGIGIESKHLDRLFERFYRIDKSRSRSQGGTGLGLAIVKHIVKNFNGTIEVQSEYGKGTKIIIILPTKK